MLKNKNLKFIIPVLFAIFAFGIKVARADDDDDDDNFLSEIVIDLIIGVAIGACQNNPTCHAKLGMFCMVFLFISLIYWCASGCVISSPSRRGYRRAGTMYIGNRLIRG